MMAKKIKVDKTVEDGKLCAILAYLLVGIIWYFADDKMKKNKFAKFHVKQGLVFFIAAIIVGIVDGFLVWIPIIGWLAITILHITLLVLFIVGLVNSANGKKKPLPIIGSYAKKFTF